MGPADRQLLKSWNKSLKQQVRPSLKIQPYSPGHTPYPPPLFCCVSPVKSSDPYSHCHPPTPWRCLAVAGRGGGTRRVGIQKFPKARKSSRFWISSKGPYQFIDLFCKDDWTLKTGYFEDPNPAIQVQALPLEGPRSLGSLWYTKSNDESFSTSEINFIYPQEDLKAARKNRKFFVKIL